MQFRGNQRAGQSPGTDQRHILVVEDSRTFSLALRLYLEKATGLKVMTCASFKELRELIVSHPHDFTIAVVDLTLPDAPYGEAVDCTIQNGIPSIVFTGRFDEKTRERIMGRDVIDYVLKDSEFALDMLVASVKRALANRDTRILVVDDMASTRGVLTRMLSIQQYQVIEANSGARALALLEADDSIRLVLADYHMPDMDGYQLTRLIRKRRTSDRLRVIGISSSTDRGVSAGFLKAGANDFLARPFVPEELNCRVANNADTLAQLNQLRTIALSDVLTGLHNRRHFFEQGPILVGEAKFAGKPSSVAILDIDHFKRFNDGYGHLVGDQALKIVATCLSDALADTGHLLARIGGEEFVVLFPGLDQGAAAHVSEDLRRAIAAKRLVVDNQELSLTVSIGVAEFDDAPFDRTLNEADRHLYAAKVAGRNRVSPTLGAEPELKSA